MPDIKAAFIDIDGTLVTNRQLVSSAQILIDRLKQADIRVSLCTGRAIIHTLKLQNHLGVENAVYFNGGLAKEKNQVVLSLPLGDSVSERALRLTEERQLPVILHTDEHTLVLKDIPSQFHPILEAYDYPPLTQISRQELEPFLQSIYQMNVFVTSDIDETIQMQLPECLLYRWNAEAIDLQRGGCDKALGALALLKHWNLGPENAVHIGDGGNDIGMFHAMGMSVAMGNAAEEVKAHAKYVTDTAENHGVLKAFEHLGMI